MWKFVTWPFKQPRRHQTVIRLNFQVESHESPCSTSFNRQKFRTLHNKSIRASSGRLWFCLKRLKLRVIDKQVSWVFVWRHEWDKVANSTVAIAFKFKSGGSLQPTVKRTSSRSQNFIFLKHQRQFDLSHFVCRCSRLLRLMHASWEGNPEVVAVKFESWFQFDLGQLYSQVLYPG